MFLFLLLLLRASDRRLDSVRPGKRSFDGQSLHKLGGTPNPYETAIGIIGKTLAPFDEDNLIPCFGFGDGQSSLLH
jgi:hypothetical protein